MSSFNFQPLRDRADICVGSKAERDLDFYTPSSPHVFSRDQGSVTRRMRQFSGSNCQRGWRAPWIGNAAHLTLTPEPPPEPMASCTGSTSSRKRTCLGQVTGHAAKVARLGRYRKDIDHRERTTGSDRVGPSAWTSIIYDLRNLNTHRYGILKNSNQNLQPITRTLFAGDLLYPQCRLHCCQ